ncbi:DUF6597 domain-containing transcriptional factor [Dysgonomonas mossii]|uniref:DUF6597 domain-containing transcriptional factor n=1 Tax=Dysgonomonas TaxID=156973 RepID=UPI0039931358
MKYYQTYPSKILAPFVKQYWGMETTFEGDNPYLHRIIPTGLPELIFYLDYKPDVSSSRRIEDNCILNIQQNDFYDLSISNNLNIFAIYFHPEAINLFFNLPLGQFFNSNIALSHLNKQLTNELQDKLSNSQSFEEKVEIAEFHLLQILSNVSINIDFKKRQHLVNLISQSRGIISIDALVDESCLSRKQFERIFINQLGVSPKQYLKIIRFQSSLHHHSICPQSSLTELALQSGYYDQSHFINDVKSFTGSTPKEIFKECEMMSDYFGA